MVVGARGGPRIITAVWQTISNVIDFGMPVDGRGRRAARAPPAPARRCRVEDDAIERETAQALRPLGYSSTGASRERIFGAVNAIVRTQSGWVVRRDPRGGGARDGR